MSEESEKVTDEMCDNMQHAQEEFDGKVEALHEDLKELTKKYDIGLISAIFFKEEDLSGVHAYGKLNHVEEMGLAKLIEQKFLA